MVKPIAPKPSSIIAQAAGSGTALTLEKRTSSTATMSFVALKLTLEIDAPKSVKPKKAPPPPVANGVFRIWLDPSVNVIVCCATRFDCNPVTKKPKALIGVKKLNVAVPPNSDKKLLPPAVVLKPHSAPQVLLVTVPPLMVVPDGSGLSKVKRLAPGTAALKLAAAAFELVICAVVDTELSAPE